MERLSEKLAYVLNENIKALSQIEEDIIHAALHRLAAYEDTGLPPEDIKRTFNEDALLALAAKYLRTTPARIRELTEADRDNHLVVLPFLPNEDVWDYSEFFYGTPYAEYYKLRDSFIGVGVSADGKRTFEYDCFTIDPEQIGKTIFLTREEAEAALQALEVGDE